jgi:hypothetical protein
MTRGKCKEVLQALWRYKDCGYSENEIRESLDMAIKLLDQEPCEDCISRANALRVAKNEYLRGWHNALCKALSEKYSIHCEEGNFSVIQEETITGLGLSMDCAVGKDVESYMSALPSVTPTTKWIPCSERLPEVGERVLCQCQANIYEVLKLTVDGWYHDNKHCYMSGFVIAWMPLPDLYNTEMDGEE